MQKLFRNTLLIVAAIVGLQAHAYSSIGTGKHVVSPMLGFMGPGSAVLTDSPGGTESTTMQAISGFYGIGADYEFQMKEDLSLGGMFRYYSSTDSVNGADMTDTVFILGGLAHAQVINTDKWHGYLGSGVSLVKATAKRGTNNYSPSMTLGLPLALGLGYKLSDSMILGIENLRVLALGDKVNGWAVNDFMFRLSIIL